MQTVTLLQPVDWLARLPADMRIESSDVVRLEGWRSMALFWHAMRRERQRWWPGVDGCDLLLTCEPSSGVVQLEDD